MRVGLKWLEHLETVLWLLWWGDDGETDLGTKKDRRRFVETRTLGRKPSGSSFKLVAARRKRFRDSWYEDGKSLVCQRNMLNIG